MKKFFVFISAAIMCLSLVACGSEKIEESNTEESHEITETSEEDRNKALSEAVDLLEDAEQCCIRASEIISDCWPNFYKADQDLYYDLSKKAEEYLEEAKNIIGTTDKRDFCIAVKNYYKAVSTFSDFAFHLPTEHTLFTYASALSEQKNSCRDAYVELEFYSEFDN